ncbi:helix-turn-helix domain-containing protein [Mesorhizobium sp. RMAD-H1]|uniref:GlxA family transcriptional regulator n=1 Tax=Mesorhizobium sp. RMAD-H1 TaxID=2587065 RepID=UPI00160C833F|nr:helix-turn-helix domain-containing protein [Mesorhizobium sp. RMAD-H1]MBB2972963.1 transcriptional regulator GlxA family with amidase domain [Mesorhizobium sp. RMAD-H1]
MKSEAHEPLFTAVLATPHVGAGAFIIMDALASVGSLWEYLHGEEPGRRYFLPRLLSVDGEPYSDLHGLVIQPHGALGDYPEPDIIIIPEMLLDPWRPLPNSYAPIIDWICSAYQRGALVASLCSGSMLLAETGLLDGEEATSHWAFCDAIARRHPDIRFRKERILVHAGEGHRLITAGGFSSWHDLLLYLIGRVAGPEEARRTAKLFLLSWHDEGQLPFAALTVGRRHEDNAVAAAQLWVADNYANPNPVAAMAARSGLTERNFLRRFKRATGQSPMEYVRTLRIEEAKQLLETTAMPVDDIAIEVGYVEPSAFRHVFRKLVGVTPSAYRRRHLWPAPGQQHA